MTMIERLGPVIFEAGSIVLKEFLVNAGRRAIAPATESVSSALRETNSDKSHGCPYCATAKLLAQAHMYMVAAATRSAGFRDTYTKLAQKSVSDSLVVLDDIGTEPDRDTIDLTSQVARIDVALSMAEMSGNAAQVAKDIWTAMALSLDLAERFNTQPDLADSIVREVDRRLQAMDGTPIIDGKAVQVP